MRMTYETYSGEEDFYTWSFNYIEELRKKGIVLYITSYEDYKRVLEKARVVVAVFTTPTCSACMIYKPIFYSVAEKMKSDDTVFIEVDAYYAPEAAYEVGVMATPTTVIYINGEPVDGIVGIIDEESLMELIENAKRRIK